MPKPRNDSPREGDKAPSFEIPDETGATRKSSEFRGKKLVLYFYPKDDTSGCTREATDFSARREDFRKAGAVVVGVSRDSVEKHRKFKEKYDLGVTLLSDEDGTLCASFGVWVEKSMYGRKYMGIERSTFLIDGEGVVRDAWRKVTVPGHIDAVLAAVENLD
jgi:peroxiredoxin Q/BCP